jgi:DAACS family dicarboxylate/amino acid:cation (Na+ or H+) symporter
VPVRLQLAIALGLVAGLLLGLAAAVTQAPLLVVLAEGVEPIGVAFVDLLKMVVIPLVAAVIFVGVSSLGDLRRLGRMGGAAMGFFAVTSVVGVLLGMGVMRAFLPLASESAAQAITVQSVAAPALPGPIDFLLGLIPSNPFQAAAEGALLPLIVFVVMFAAASGTLPEEQRDRLLGLAKAIAAALIKLTHWILWIAPVGIFALAAPVTARAGWAMLQSLIAFVVAVLVALAVFVALVYVPAVRFLARRSVGKFLKGCVSPQVIAAATVSSPATVPAMLEAADDELRVSSTVSGFVIPLGAGLGRAGSAVFQGAGLVFLAWLFGVSLAISGIGGAVLATVIVSFTVPSIPGGRVLSLAPALGTVGIPLDGLAVLLGVDRIHDMARTATNVTGTLTATVLVDRLEEGTSTASQVA